jgi:CBS domain containing-hemolysin-like protein
MSTTGIDLAPWQQQAAGHELVESSFMVRNRPIEDLMLPRGAITWLDMDGRRIDKLLVTPLRTQAE